VAAEVVAALLNLRIAVEGEGIRSDSSVERSEEPGEEDRWFAPVAAMDR